MPKPTDYAAKRLNELLPNHHPHKPGPKTEAGKQRSALNAIRHGLSGRVVVLPTEDMSLYRQYSEDFVSSLHPETPLERELAQHIADGYWRLKRVRTTEESLFALGHDEGQGDFDADTEEIHAAYTTGKTFRDHSRVFVNLSIYEQRINRGIEKNTKQLRELQAERIEHRKAEVAALLRLRDLNKSKNLPYIPAEDGFVYASEEIEVEAHRRDRRRAADELATNNTNLAQFPKRAA